MEEDVLGDVQPAAAPTEGREEDRQEGEEGVEGSGHDGLTELTATPEEMERYYAGDYAVWGSQEGETEEEWMDFYARCCSQHHRVDREKREAHQASDEYRNRQRNRRRNLRKKRARRRHE